MTAYENEKMIKKMTKTCRRKPCTSPVRSSHFHQVAVLVLSSSFVVVVAVGVRSEMTGLHRLPKQHCAFGSPIICCVVLAAYGLLGMDDERCASGSYTRFIESSCERAEAYEPADGFWREQPRPSLSRRSTCLNQARYVWPALLTTSLLACLLGRFGALAPSRCTLNATYAGTRAACCV